jgi:mono/diheme cytochrome c family protein
VTAGFTDVDWDHAIRYALRPGGSWVLPFMPYHLFSCMTDGDTTALIAYLKIVPRVDRVLPPTKLRLPGYVMVGLPRFDLDELLPRRAGPEGSVPDPGTHRELRRYLASTTCVKCHGQDLRGGKHLAPDAPPAPSLIPAAS